MAIIGWIIFGLIVGAIARFLMPGAQSMGTIMTILLGVAGSFVAFYIGKFLGLTAGHPGSLRPVGFIPSLIGAIIVLLVYHAIRRRRR